MYHLTTTSAKHPLLLMDKGSLLCLVSKQRREQHALAGGSPSEVAVGERGEDLFAWRRGVCLNSLEKRVHFTPIGMRY